MLTRVKRQAHGDRTFTWDKVRQLSSVSDTNLQVDYTYDDSGIRTSKTVNGVTTHYNTKDGVILAQSDGENTLYFQYDTSGNPFSFVWNDAQYFYVTNQMGDVMGITDGSGNLLVQYHYDAWGKLLSATLTDANNATQKQLAGGANLYSYCHNEPTNSYDNTGFLKLYLKNKKINNVIVKLARKISYTWTVSTKPVSLAKIRVSALGITIYMGASASTSLTLLKNKTSGNSKVVKVTDKYSLSFGKYKKGFTVSRTINGNTVKGTVTVGSNSVAMAVSVITKYYYTSRVSCYFSVDVGFKIKHITSIGAAAVVAAACVAVPYIAPAATKIYVSMAAAVTSYKAFFSVLTTITSAIITMAGKVYA